MLARFAIAALAVFASFGVAAAQDGGKVKVVASFSIIADVVRHVGGERVAVTSLVAPNADAHVFSPAPADARIVGEADLIVVNGLGFEGWLDRLVKASGSKAPVVIATRGIKAIKTEEDHGHGHKHGHGHQHGHKHGHKKSSKHDHDHGPSDPHAWQSVRNVMVYATNVRDALIAADPDGKDAYEANARAYLGDLEALDREVRDAIAKIPEDARRVVTNHDAFAYFAAEYGLQFMAVHGLASEAQASAKDVARIIAQVRKHKIRAVFLENISDERQVRRIAKETGARIGGTLYSDALTGRDGPAPTYIDMIRHNLRTLQSALMS